MAAGKVGVSRIDGVPVRPEEIVYPLLIVLPMGFSFALHWTQQAHDVILRRGERLLPDRSDLLVDFCPPNLDEQVGKVVYLDDGVFASATPTCSGACQELAADVLHAAGLPVHEVVPEQSSLEVLGLQFEHHCVRIRLARRWRLQ